MYILWREPISTPSAPEIFPVAVIDKEQVADKQNADEKNHEPCERLPKIQLPEKIQVGDKKEQQRQGGNGEDAVKPVFFGGHSFGDVILGMLHLTVYDDAVTP